MSGEAAAGSVVYSCPLESCEWTFTQAPPDPFASVSVPIPPAATLDESISAAAFAITREWLGVADRAVGAHLSAHTTLEWVTEIMRLRQAATGTVAVSREDLALVHDYARQFDVDGDPAMVRVAAILRTEQPAGSSPPAAD